MRTAFDAGINFFDTADAYGDGLAETMLGEYTSVGTGSVAVNGRDVGTISGRFEYAEGWRRRNHLGFCAADADPLAEALGDLVAHA